MCIVLNLHNIKRNYHLVKQTLPTYSDGFLLYRKSQSLFFNLKIFFMKQRFITGTSLLMLAFCAMLLSFSTVGGDHFEIYLNKKLVVEQYVSQTSGVKSLVLKKSDANSQLDVYYSHCGKIGNERTIVIKDGQKNVLKKLRFADGDDKFMSCKVKDILNVQKNEDTRLYLYYSSKQLPEGRLLASIAGETVSNKTTP